jgi:two-component system sensor histidine kinase YesM
LEVRAVKLRTRIFVLFLAGILFSAALSILSTAYFGRKNYIAQEREISAQTLRALANNLKLKTDYVRQDTDTVFWTPLVQNALDSLKTEPMTPETRAFINDSLSPIMLAADYISSIIFYDNYGNSCICLRDGVLVDSGIRAQDTAWYAAAAAADGDWIYETDGGGIVSYTDDNRNVVSMIKIVKSKDDYTPCGVLMVNIDESTLRRSFTAFSGDKSACYILSGGKTIFSTGDGTVSDKTLSNILSGKLESGMNSGALELYQHQALDISDWQLVSVMQIKAYGLSINCGPVLIVFLGNLAFLLLCWRFITMNMTKPLKEMETRLDDAEGIPEDFYVAPDKTDEISNVKRAYNHMAASARELLVKTREEEQAVQRGELELVLSQVSPHFLYNTLDTISGMILSGDAQRSFALVQSLGMFYRNSLGSGQQTVTLGEELVTVQSYLEILNTRYGDRIRVEYRVDDDLRQREILKLTIQPLVENAVHHGLRPRGGDGTIVIGAVEEDGALLVSVLDDGVGISQKKLSRIRQSTAEETPGFGLFSIRRRIALFYGTSDPLTIESREGEWTKVTVHIPLRGGEAHEQAENPDR